MDTPYSTIAVKYVGSTPAQDAVDVLRELHKSGDVDLRDAVAVTRSADGEMEYYPWQTLTPGQGALGLGITGFVVGLLFGRPVRWAILGAALGAGVGAMSGTMKQQGVLATVPYVEKGESVLYMEINDANWSEFLPQIRPFLDQGLMVVRRLAPAHVEARSMLAGATAWQVPPQEEFPEPPGGGTPVPLEEAPQAEDSSALSRQRASAVQALPPQESPEADDNATDDLTAIKGIGPVIATRLRDGGVRTFAQLAAMGADQIAQIAGVPATRITRGDWSGQAKTLAVSV